MNRAFPARRRACKRSSLRALVLAASLAAAFGSAAAVGLGRPVTASSLGQSLNLIVPLRLEADEMLAPECVSAEVMVGESRLPAPLVRVVLESGGDGLPRALRVVSVPPVEEPVVVVNVAVGCPARLTRQFVAFIDPPPTQAQVPPPQLAQLLQPAPLPTPAAPPEAPRRAASAPQQLAQATVEPPPRSVPAKPRPKPRVVRLTADGEGQPAAAAVTPPPPAKPAARPAPRAVAAAKASAPLASTGRLKLDAPEAAVVAPAAAASAVDVAALLARAASGAGGAESAEGQRLRQLENSLAQLRAEAKQTHETLAALRLQLQRAQQERSPNSLIYGLGLLTLLLGGACLYLWRLRERELHQREMAWWNSPEAAGHALKQEGGAAEAASPVAPVVEPVAVMPPAAVVPAAPPAPLSEPTARSTSPAPVTQVAQVETIDTSDMPLEVLEALRVSREPAPPLHEQTLAFARVSAAPDFSAAKYLPDLPMMELGEPASGLVHSEPELRSDFVRSAFGAHEVSAEELIDLEQQAEFFVVLGQDEAAVELLQGHVQGHQGGSALPYLKLLEIHRRRGDITAYAEISEILTQRFGVLPPDWDADPEAAHGLEAYPEVLARLQKKWNDHGASMDLLQRLLVRPQGREAGEGAGPASSMDIAAYLDMLLLYSVARDLSEREVRGNEVDVFLPLDLPGDSPQSTAMMATLPVQVDGPRSRLGELDLDISIGGDNVNSKL